MPACSAASTRPVPFGTWTSFSSTVMRTSSGALKRELLRYRGVLVLVDGGEEVRERRVLAERAAAVLEVRVELVAELRHARRDGHRRGVAEHAQALADDPVADVEADVEILLGRAAVLDRLEDLDEPARAD